MNSSTGFDRIQFWREGRVGVIALDHGPLNLIDQAMLEQISSALLVANGDDKVEVLAITGSGRSFFSAGVDWRSVSNPENFLKASKALVSLITSFEKPTVTLVNSHAFGGGLELSLLTDFRFTREGTLLAFPEGKVGLPTVFLGIYFFGKLAGQSVARRVFYLGESITSEEALRLNLADRILPRANFYGEAQSVLSGLPSSSPALSVTKKIFQDPAGIRLADEVERRYVSQYLGKLPGEKEGGASSVERLREEISGALENEPCS
jgi:enoyl-CoA hydratase/carnithine racemase